VCGGVQVAVNTEHLVNVVAAVEPAKIPALATYDLEMRSSRVGRASDCQ
jgi:hypothetical protein